MEGGAVVEARRGERLEVGDVARRLVGEQREADLAVAAHAHDGDLARGRRAGLHASSARLAHEAASGAIPRTDARRRTLARARDRVYGPPTMLMSLAPHVVVLCVSFLSRCPSRSARARGRARARVGQARHGRDVGRAGGGGGARDPRARRQRGRRGDRDRVRGGRRAPVQLGHRRRRLRAGVHGGVGRDHGARRARDGARRGERARSISTTRACRSRARRSRGRARSRCPAWCRACSSCTSATGRSSGRSS